MAKPKGSPKTGGRQKGTPNKRTRDLLEAFEALNIDLPSRIRRELVTVAKLGKHRRYKKDVHFQLNLVRFRTDLWLELMNYVYPKRKSIEVSGELDLKNTADADLVEEVREAMKVLGAKPGTKSGAK